MKKRVVAILMTLVMVCSLLPVSVLATGNTYDDKDEAAAATGVTANKTVSKNDDGTYTVTLSVTGTSEDNPETINHPADIVLVIDDSGSMDDRVSQKCAAESYFSHEEWYPIIGTVTVYTCDTCGETFWDLEKVQNHNTTTTRMALAKEAAKTFVNGLLTDGSQVKIGLVGFSGNVNMTQELTDNVKTLTDQIDNRNFNANHSDGTNYENALKAASDLLKSGSNKQQFIVFVSDGEPNRGHAKPTADELKQAGVTIFTVGIDLRDNQAGALKEISTGYPDAPYYYGAASTALASILQKITEEIISQIHAGKNAVMTDVVNTDSFELVPEAADEALEVGEDGRLTWTIGDITKDTKTVTFTIKLKEGNTEAGELYTNRDVNLTFDSTALDGTVQFTKNAIGTPQIGVYSVRYTDGVDSAEVFEDQITYNLVEGDATPTFAGGNPQREDHTFLGWSPSVLETISGDIYEIVYTAQWTPNTTPVDPKVAAYQIQHYREADDGTYTLVDTVLPAGYGEIGQNATVKETDYKSYEGFAYDPHVEGTVTSAEVFVPSEVEGELQIATLKLYYSKDENDDNIPDRYQKKLTFTVIHGAWNDGENADVVKYVTLTDGEGNWSANGSYTVTADDVFPAAGERPDEGFKAGAWDKTLPAVGDVITADASYVYAYQRGSSVIDPKVAAYQVEHYQEEQNGMYTLAETEFPLYGPIGETVSATPKDYRGYTLNLNHPDCVASGTVVLPTIPEGAESPEILTLKLYYDLAEAPSWDTSKSKTATNLNASYESQVTLSLPSSEEALVSDVVFVLDKSTSAALEEQALEMLSNLKAQVENTGASVKVGVVIFNKTANKTDWMDLGTQYEDIEAAITEEISSGTNTHAGLLAGKAMLDADTSVDASRKYLIFVSDGITYLYNEEPTATAWSWTVDGSTNTWAGPDNWNSKYGSNDAPSVGWEEWLSTIGTQVAAQGITYEYPYGGTVSEATPPEKYEEYANSIDKALYLTNQVYQSAKAAGYHCYAMTAESVSGAQYTWGPSFVNYLANNEELTFTEIQNEILYLLGAGSKVVDVIGSGADNTGSAYDFEFVQGAGNLRLTVGEVSYTASESTQDLGEGETARYVFHADGVAAANQAEAPFVLHYYKNGTTVGGQTLGECFVWDINIHVTNFAHVQLTYKVKLTNPALTNHTTSSITHGTYDGDGGHGYTTGLYTNNQATLYPVASDGVEGQPESFQKPTVSYTVPGTGYQPPDTPDDSSDDDDDDGGGKLNTKDHYSYIIGYKDGELKPYGTITRGEVATIFFRLLTDEAREEYWCQTNNYTDVPADLWCNNAISTLTNMGIIDGYQDGSFRPYGRITRAQFAKMAVGFFETTTEEYQGYYTDVPENAWFTEYVEAASRVGLIQGFEDGTYRPDTNITRAQACVIVNRALNRKPDKNHLLPEREMIVWPDMDEDDWFYADMMEATNSHDYVWKTRNGKAKAYEEWTEKLPQRDWAAFENMWADAHSAPGGEVVKN